MIHKHVVMEFEHPIFITPEDYEEYKEIMTELAEAAERSTPDPQPQDLGLNNNSFFNQKSIDLEKVQA